MKQSGIKALNALVVDDNEVNRLVLVDMLNKLRIQADQASDGINAVLRSNQKAYNLIFMDHIMPKMDGAKAVTKIRKSFLCRQSVIFALTSEITISIRELYKSAGVNDMCLKPIDFHNLTTMITKWFPDFPIDIGNQNTDENIFQDKDEFIKSILETIIDIDYLTGLKSALGNPRTFINILEISLKDIHACITSMNHSLKHNLSTEILNDMHKLRNILNVIGAIRLKEKTISIENGMQQKGIKVYLFKSLDLLNNLEELCKKIQSVIEQYHRAEQAWDAEVLQNNNAMTLKEYEQCLLKAIYYIKRYEFETIIEELEGLIEKGVKKDRAVLKLALIDVRAYDYDKALGRIEDLLPGAL